MNDDERERLALWRYALLGRLVSMRLEHGELREQLREAADEHYHHPLDGELVQVSARTLENWYYRYHRHGLAGLAPLARKDRGRSRKLDPELVELIIRAKREKPRRSLRRIIKILERAGRAMVRDPFAGCELPDDEVEHRSAKAAQTASASSAL